MGSLPEPTTVSQHRDLETRIIGGKVADSTRFPYYTYVRITSTEGDTSCGGSLIAPDVVMTAAHCIVPEYDYDTVNAVDVWVNSTDLAYTKYQYYRAATRWVAHPAFELERVMNDIGLIFLDAPVKGVPFVKINRNASIPDSTNSSVLTAIGLGAIDAPAQYPKFLMQVGIYPVSLPSCIKTYGSWKVGDSNLCAGGGGKKGTCYGDSGGPLLSRKASAQYDVQMGITSWGEDYRCVSEGSPSVFTRVSSHAEWIDAQICKYGKSQPSTCSTLKPSIKPTTRKPTTKSSL